ncbi:putative 1-aminocyclopropane-1-carboxylate synthase [Colletotrichum sublineola]|uniref:Putative 1-aminocyclopropane-1-carboxylate synthase n=1 Tax=Colletotrichum sublineola TaxID=1173701 RepID=A0A066XPY4_COLSU|nr:putative 1-aminocyclopropane-1-carboxylate synthase [Colletotrichum sublineola]
MISFALASNSLVLEDLSSFAAQVPLPPDVFTYGYSTAGGARLRAALASHLNLTFNPHAQLTIDDVQLASGATAVHSILAFALASPGEGILTSRPVHGRFELDFGNETGVEVVYADTAPETCFGPDVVEAFEVALQRSHEREGEDPGGDDREPE